MARRREATPESRVAAAHRAAAQPRAPAGAWVGAGSGGRVDAFSALNRGLIGRSGEPRRPLGVDGLGRWVLVSWVALSLPSVSHQVGAALFRFRTAVQLGWVSKPASELVRPTRVLKAEAD